MTEQTRTRIPAPIYAAAGVGDYAVQQLRKLPAYAAELRDKATSPELRERAQKLRDRVTATDLEKLRDEALRNANTFVAGAQERAVALYTDLVARGERVVGSGVVQTAATVDADIETTEAPAQVAATPAKPKKKATRPAAGK